MILPLPEHTYPENSVTKPPPETDPDRTSWLRQGFAISVFNQPPTKKKKTDMWCDTRSRFMWGTWVFPPRPMVKIYSDIAFDESSTILLCWKAESSSLDRASMNLVNSDLQKFKCNVSRYLLSSWSFYCSRSLSIFFFFLFFHTL